MSLLHPTLLVLHGRATAHCTGASHVQLELSALVVAGFQPYGARIRIDHIHDLLQPGSDLVVAGLNGDLCRFAEQHCRLVNIAASLCFQSLPNGAGELLLAGVMSDVWVNPGAEGAVRGPSCDDALALRHNLGAALDIGNLWPAGHHLLTFALRLQGEGDMVVAALARAPCTCRYVGVAVVDRSGELQQVYDFWTHLLDGHNLAGLRELQPQADVSNTLGQHAGKRFPEPRFEVIGIGHGVSRTEELTGDSAELVGTPLHPHSPAVAYEASLTLLERMDQCCLVLVIVLTVSQELRVGDRVSDFGELPQRDLQRRR